MSVTIHQEQLSNGLTLLGESNPQNKSAGIGFFVKTGARDETPVESGLSHFLEHMMFKGTEKRNSMQITFELGSLGAQANAYTSEEQTVYYAGVLPEYFDSIQELLSDMLRPSLDNKEFDMEKKVILEEIALYQDRPHIHLFEQALKEYFSGHTAGNSVLGTTQSVGAISRDQMKSYFDRRYSPSNMVLVASGNFDWNKFKKNAERYCGSWQDHKAGREVKPFPGHSVKRSYNKKDINQAHLLYITQGPSAQEPSRYPMGLLSMILGDHSGSKLYWKLVNTGIAESAHVDQDEKDGVGAMMVYCCMAPDRINQVADLVQEVMAKPREFTEQDLERACNKLVSRVVLNGELPMGRLMSLGSEWLARKRVHNLKETIAKIKAVTKNDIEEALNSYPMKVWSEFRLLPD